MGCFAEEEDEEVITFNGRNLNGNPVYEFTLETAYGDLWNLSEEEGKNRTRLYFHAPDNICPVTSENLSCEREAHRIRTCKTSNIRFSNL